MITQIVRYRRKWFITEHFTSFSNVEGFCIWWHGWQPYSYDVSRDGCLCYSESSEHRVNLHYISCQVSKQYMLYVCYEDTHTMTVLCRGWQIWLIGYHIKKVNSTLRSWRPTTVDFFSLACRVRKHYPPQNIISLLLLCLQYILI